ncbi:MAG: HAD-IA family hydrolase [Candidatus Yanofskybacteria bacterium]|nr:HAD-IA family hydrolase [Candidatus Yanofskybacteria bacterium]
MEAERKYRQIDAFFVDIGRVLIDFLNPRFYEKVALLAELPASIVEEVDRKVLRALWPDLEKGRLSFYDFFLRFKTELVWVVPDGKIEELVEKFTFTFFRDASKDLLRLKKRTLGFIKFLKSQGYRIVIVSNNNSGHLYYQAILFPEVFAVADGCFLSHEIGHRKPEKEFWLVVLNSIGVAPDKVFVIDDLKENVDSAKALGMHGAVFTNVKELKKELNSFGFHFKN